MHGCDYKKGGASFKEFGAEIFANLGLAPISLRANGHDPAEATRQRLLTL